MRLVPICQSFLITARRNTTSSAMLRNLHTIIEQTPSARVPPTPPQKQIQLTPLPGKHVTRSSSNARAQPTSPQIFATKNIEAQAMYTWNSKLSTHEATRHEQPTNACLDPSGLANVLTCQPLANSSSMEFHNAEQPCQFSVWTTNAIETIEGITEHDER